MKSDFHYHGPVVVFDLDDTLFRERDFCRSGFKWIGKELSKKYGNRFLALPMRLDSLLRRRESYFDLLERLLKDIGAPDNEMKRLVEGYRSHKPGKLEYAEGAEKVLVELQKRGVIMGLITDGRSVTQRRKIEALGLDKFISEDNIYISEERGADKTSPDSFRAIVRSYPEAKCFIYVGDNPRKDFIMPNLMGWITCKVPTHIDNVHPVCVANDPLGEPINNLNEFNDILGLL